MAKPPKNPGSKGGNPLPPGAFDAELYETLDALLPESVAEVAARMEVSPGFFDVLPRRRVRRVPRAGTLLWPLFHGGIHWRELMLRAKVSTPSDLRARLVREGLGVRQDADGTLHGYSR